jgi:hypothetical protein
MGIGAGSGVHRGLYCRCFSGGNLGLADGLLDFAFCLTAGVSGYCAGDGIGLSFDLLDYAGGDVFLSQDDFFWSGSHIG